MIFRCQGLRIVGEISGFGFLYGDIIRCRILPLPIVSAAKRDDHGHFYKEEGASCPHGKGGGRTERKKSDVVLSEAEQWESWGIGRSNADEVLKGKNIYNAMKRVNGESVNFIYDKDCNFGFTHTENKNEIRDKDAICDTIAFGTDEEETPKKKVLIRHNGFLVVLNHQEKDGSRNFITGYPEDKDRQFNR